MKPDSVRLSFEFNTFKSSDYTWGGYQSIEEITYNQAINKTLRNQDNWIADYVILNNIDKNYKSFGSFTDNNIGIDESEHYYDSREEQRENERNADFYLNEGDPNWEANRDQEDFDRAFYGDDD
jgi:hypothetical protein